MTQNGRKAAEQRAVRRHKVPADQRCDKALENVENHDHGAIFETDGARHIAGAGVAAAVVAHVAIAAGL